MSKHQHHALRMQRQPRRTQSAETTTCPFCGHERNLRIVGMTPCERHRADIPAESVLGDMLIDALDGIRCGRKEVA